jgi:hypothetical protein
MKNPDTQGKIKNWSRMAARVGVLLADPKVRKEVGNFLKHRFNAISEVASDRYDEGLHRMTAAGDALRGRSPWRARTVGFLAGVGVGAGIAILVAPNSGAQTRGAIRSRASAVSKGVGDSASSVVAKFSSRSADRSKDTAVSEV